MPLIAFLENRTQQAGGQFDWPDQPDPALTSGLELVGLILQSPPTRSEADYQAHTTNAGINWGTTGPWGSPSGGVVDAGDYEAIILVGGSEVDTAAWTPFVLTLPAGLTYL